GTNWVIQAVAGGLTTDAVTGINSSYDLDGSGTANNDAGGASFVVEAVISSVATADAIDISTRLDGLSMSQPANSALADLAGRVKYATPVNGLTDVYIYICHR